MKTRGNSARFLLGFAGLGVCASCWAVATDGLQVGSGEWKTHGDADGLETAQPFRNGVLPTDGGVWTLLPEVEKTTMNTMDATIRGVDFGDRSTLFNGTLRKCWQSTDITGTKTLTFTGEDAFVDGSICGRVAVAYGTLLLSHYMFDTFYNPVSVPADTHLTLKGASVKRFDNISGEGKITVAGGELVFRKASDGALYGGEVEVGHGNLAWKPGLTAGASAAVTLPSVSVSLPGTFLTVDPSSGDQAQLTLGSLALASSGSLVLFAPGMPTPGLGGRAKVLVSDPAGVPVHDGVVDANVMGLSDTLRQNGMRFHFLSYDGTDGFKVLAPTASLEVATATDLACVTSSTTLAAGRQVKGLVLDPNGCSAYDAKVPAPTLTVPEGMTLKIGDDANPAALVVNISTGYQWKTASALNGSGTIDFGGSEGFVYHGGSTEQTALDVNTTLAGSNGLNFIGTHSGIEINLNRAAGWTGPTRVGAGIRLVADAADRLPSGGDVFTLDTGRGYAAQICLIKGATWNQNFHLSGFGYCGSLANFAAMNLNKQDHAFPGAFVLEGDTGISCAGSSTFSGPFSGPGKLVIGASLSRAAAFSGPYTATGGLLLSEGRLAFDGPAVPGTGKVETMPETLLFFWNDVGSKTTVPNAIDAQGTLVCRKADVAFTGPVSASCLSLDSSEVTVKDLTVASVVAHGSTRVGAVDADSTLTFDAAADSATAVVLEDGAGRLSVVKDGAGTLTLTRPQDYSGATTVREGTLRLNGDILDGPDIAFWLDETSMVVDENNVVTEWRSKVGNQKFKVKEDYSDGSESLHFTGPLATETINGRRVATFSNDRYTALATPISGQRATVRSCFIVYRMAETMPAICGFFGRYNQGNCNDIGLRLNGAGTALEADSNFLTGTRRQNGVESLSCTRGRTTVLSMCLTDLARNGMGKIDESFASSWYLLGLRYWNHGTFEGDIAECIAFDRELSDDEAKYVENYLAKKWGVSDELHAGVPVPGSRVLPAATALTVEEDAVLDLNGVSAIVASLSGRGRIVNTGTKPAVLTVTGTSSFSGHVENNVTVAASGTLEADVGAGAALRATGDLVVKPYVAPGVPTNGLALWCDAYETSLMERSGHRLTGRWLSKCGRIAGFLGDGGDKPYCDFGPDWYCLSVIEQKKERLVTTDPVSLRTVYICAQSNYEDLSKAGYDMLLGIEGKDWGYRASLDGLSIESVGLTRQPKSVTINGSTTWTHEKGKRFVFAYRCGLDQTTPLAGSPDGSVLGTRKLTIGKSCNLYSFNGLFFEVLIYERDVTDREDELIRAYLTEKWISRHEASGQRKPYIRPAATTSLDAQASLLLANGANVSFTGTDSVTLASIGGAGTILGNVTLTGSLVADAAGGPSVPMTTVDGNLVIGGGAEAIAVNCRRIAKQSHPALTVTGSVTGDFAEMTVPNVRPEMYEWSRRDNVWSVNRYSGLKILLR